MKKKFSKENLLYLFLILSPIFDLFSSLFKYLNFSYTPSTFLRPIIPVILIIFIFFKDKLMRKKIFIASLIYVLYAFIHLYLYSNIIRGISYGGIIHEAQYIVNYTYLVFTLFLFIYVFKNKDDSKLKDLVLYSSMIYIFSIYISIITNTSLSSYTEALGYKGWFNTSGAVGSLLVLSLFVILTNFIKNKKNILFKILYSFLIVCYLCFLIGSRIGLLGSIIAIVSLIFSNIFFNKKINIKKYFPYIISIIIVFIISFTIVGSYTLERRAYLNRIKDKEIHIAYDVLDVRNNIKDKKVKTNYVTKEQAKSIESLYKYANKAKLSNINLRKQQLIYHSYLYIYQKNMLLKLFGNGYLANFGCLTLEMETIALIYNFGIFGFVLYLVPFLSIFIYGLYMGIKNIKKIDSEYVMYLSGILTSYLISLFAGHTYFNTSVMPIIIILHVLLLNKILDIKRR